MYRKKFQKAETNLFIFLQSYQNIFLEIEIYFNTSMCLCAYTRF